MIFKARNYWMWTALLPNHINNCRMALTNQHQNRMAVSLKLYKKIMYRLWFNYGSMLCLYIFVSSGFSLLLPHKPSVRMYKNKSADVMLSSTWVWKKLCRIVRSMLLESYVDVCYTGIDSKLAKRCCLWLFLFLLLILLHFEGIQRFMNIICYAVPLFTTMCVYVFYSLLYTLCLLDFFFESVLLCFISICIHPE